MHKYSYDYNQDGKIRANLDEEESKRMNYNVSHIYDILGKNSPAISSLIEGRDEEKEDVYDPIIVFDRFKQLFDFENSKDAINLKLDMVDKGEVSE